MKQLQVLIISIFMLAVCNTFDIMAQIRMNVPVKESTGRPYSDSYKPTSLSKRKKSIKITEDTIYSISTKKQHGWLMPLHIINIKEISKHSNVYRFSKKNSSGNWCRVECLDGRGNLDGGAFRPYIVKTGSELDTLASADWKEKLKTTCRIDFIADPLGDKVIQERAYDKENHLIYSFSVSPIDSEGIGFIGSYRDFFGLPAEMRVDPDFSYGTLVYILRDRCGNDSIIRYMDSQGYVKPNSDGVYCEQFIYDDKGRLVMSRSMDSNDNFVFDNCGNCGVEYVYDDNDNLISTTYMDTSWNPMKMPTSNNEIRHLYSYDNFSRLIEQRNVDQDNNPIENSLGTHRVVYGYNRYGEYTEVCGFDKLGNPSPYDSSGACKSTLDYNDWGNVTESHNYDGMYRPLDSEMVYSSIYSSFDKDNVLIGKACYSIVDGKELLVSSFEKNGQEDVTKWSDGTSKIERYDNFGRVEQRIYYDAQGNPDYDVEFQIEDYMFDVAREEIPFSNQFVSDVVDVKLEKDFYRNKSRNTYANSDGKYQIIAEYAGEALVDIHGQALTDGKPSRHDDLNGYGHVSLCGGSSGIRCFGASAIRTLSGQFLTLYGLDQFGEPSYIDINNGSLYCYQLTSRNNECLYIDEYNNIIDSNDRSLRDRCPKYLSVEICDSIAYELGFDDNDVILSINEISIDPLTDEFDFMVNKSLMSVALSKEEKVVRLFHVDPATLSVSVKDILVGKGHLEDYGIKLHCLYATDRQSQRIREAAVSFDLVSPSYFDASGDSSAVVISYLPYRNDQLKEYNVLHGHDAVLLAAQIEGYPLLKWRYCDGFISMNEIKSIRKDILDNNLDSIPVLRLFVTNDGLNIRELNIEDLNVGCRIMSAHIDSCLADEMASLSQSIDLVCNYDPMASLKSYKKLDEASKDEIYNRARVYYSADFNHVAFDMFKKLADAGYSKAYPYLADCYANGWGTKEDLKLSEKYALKADTTGYSVCRTALKLIEHNQNHKAVALLRIVNEKQNYFDLAQMYMGDAIRQEDEQLALDYYFKALNDCFSLARTDKTETLIDSLLKIDSSSAMTDSIYSVGKKLYLKNKDKEAFSIFLSLVDNGYSPATMYLADCYLYGYGVEKNLDMAIALGEKEFSKTQNSAALVGSAEFLMNNKEYNRAIQLLVKVTDSGNNRFLANYYLGKIYLNPDFYGKNDSKAFKYWRDALSLSDIYSRHEKSMIDMEEILLSHPTKSSDIAHCVFYLAWEYLDNSQTVKALDLLRKVLDVYPEISKENSLFNSKYYQAMHDNGIPSTEEYESFIKSTRAMLYIPDINDESSDLYAYRGQYFPIVSLNGWNKNPDCQMTNIFKDITNDNKVFVEVDSKAIEVPAHMFDPSNIRFVTIEE